MRSWLGWIWSDGIFGGSGLEPHVGLDRGLAAQGVKESDIEPIADGVIRYMGGSIAIDPMNPTKKDLVEILKKSM